MRFYRQCTFEIERTASTSKMTAWIEESAAKLGNRVSFVGEGGVYWKVVSVGTTRLPEGFVKQRERDHLKQRAVSDI